MKQTTLVTILLVFMVLIGWVVVLTAKNQNMSADEDEYLIEYQNHIALAEDYVERGLYQKAIQEYETAITFQDSEKLRTTLLEVYLMRYEEDTGIYSDYISAVASAASSFPQNVDYLRTLTDYYLSGNDYSSAYSVLSRGVENGIEDEWVTELLQKVKYAYSTSSRSYTQYTSLVNGYYAVCDTSGSWTYIDESGDKYDIGDLLFAGPIGESGIFVIQTDIRAELIDVNNVVQGILSIEPEEAGVFSENLIAIKDKGKYAYYNILGDLQFGEYDAAGVFTDGIAAVQQDEDWFFIDTQGQKTSSDTYEDIVLLPDGSYTLNGTMLAKADGAYHIYSAESIIGSYEDVDILTSDEMIAVCIDGKWGYVDTQGNEVIAPQYEMAKSFSNGLAAVSIDGDTWGFIDKEGTLVIDDVFLNADYFNTQSSCMVEIEEDAWLFITLYVTQ